LGILEYINLDKLRMDKREIRRAKFDREQYYLDMMNPTLNILKIAGYILGYKHTEKKCEELWVYSVEVKI
jgi:hypothetical protein